MVVTPLLKGLDAMKVEKTQFEKVIKALLALPPMPMKTFEGKGRPKKERPEVESTEPQMIQEPES
jgi:hypothetical protein